MKKKLIETTRSYLKSQIHKHVMNLEVIFVNPIAIPEHTDIMGAIEKELEYISTYHDKLEVLNQYFENKD
jgi:hypothetical protein